LAACHTSAAERVLRLDVAGASTTDGALVELWGAVGGNCS
jgi:hypothetical protein